MVLSFQEALLVGKQGMLFGYCLDIHLYGILTVQTYLYYIAFPNDNKVTKATVAFVYGVDTAQTIVALYTFYLTFCLSKDYLDSFVWITIPLTSAIVATVAQLFYARRIYVLSRKKVVTGIVIVLSLTQLVFGIITVMVFRGIFPVGVNFKLLFIPLGWGVPGIVCDLVIAVYLFWFLTIQMRRASKMTRITVAKIKRLLLETGLLTAIMTTALSLLYILGISNLYTIFGLSLGKVYSNSILVLLNNRFTIAGGRNGPTLEFEINSYRLTEIPRRESVVSSSSIT